MREKILNYLTRIPKGKVVTYGQIAAFLGNPRLCRYVGNVLHTNTDGEKYPCYKVVNCRGQLAKNFAFGGIEGQKARLMAEGIPVEKNAVDLSVYQMEETVVEKKVYNKLVRDKIPQIITAGGNTCKTEILEQAPYIAALEEKLGEELAEYLQSKELEELADLMEVVDALLIAKGADWAQLEKIRLQKKEKRGGFADRIFLQYVLEAE